MNEKPKSLKKTFTTSITMLRNTDCYFNISTTVLSNQSESRYADDRSSTLYLSSYDDFNDFRIEKGRLKSIML